MGFRYTNRTHLSWNNVFLLGWRGKQLNLTQWNGFNKWIDVIIIGATDEDMKHIMWNNPLHKDFELIEVPKNVSPIQYANENKGIYAFGWYIESGINRPPNQPLKDEWDWLKKIRGY